MRNFMIGVGNITWDEIYVKRDWKGSKPGGVINLGRTWAELVDPSTVYLVSKVGNDFYTRKIVRELKKLGLNRTYILGVPNAETRLYEINVDDPHKPQIKRAQDAEKLMTAPTRDFTHLLPYTASLFYQSFATVFETPYLDSTLKTIEEADRLGVNIIFDSNIRQASVEKLKEMNDEVQSVLKRFDFLKVNEGEAKVLLDSGIDEPIESISIEEGELSKVADDISETYDVKNLAITMGERGSFIQTPNKRLRLETVKSANYINSLGCGDLYSAGLCLKYVRDLSDEETGILATVLGTLATEGLHAYPDHLTKGKIRETIRKNAQDFEKKYKLDVNRFLHKLKLG